MHQRAHVDTLSLLFQHEIAEKRLHTAAMGMEEFTDVKNFQG
jgi:hypothetical protein